MISDSGTRIAYFLNGAVSSIDLSSAGQMLGSAITGFCNMAIDFAKTFEWKALGDNISGGINGFFEKFDGAAFGEAVTSLLSGFLDMIEEGKLQQMANGRNPFNLGTA